MKPKFDSPLVVRSHYSFMRGTASPKELVRRAKEIGYRRLALTDRDNLYGLWPFLNACLEENIKPIVGAEITSPTDGRRAVCLVEEQRGFENLCRLITRRHRNKIFDIESDIKELGWGFIVLTSDASLLESWRSTGLDVAAALPRSVNSESAQVRESAARLGIPLVGVPDSYFLKPSDMKLHRLMRAISLNSTLSQVAEEEVAHADAFLAEPEEYQRRFAILPEAITGASEIAERCRFDGPAYGARKSVYIFPPWEQNGEQNGKSASEVLREKAYEGARKRYGTDLDKKTTDRLEHELAIINGKGFAEYFLVVQDIVSRSRRICGRGSGAASLVAYSLEITNVCPLKHNLYFERFLNRGRKDPPDIDIDFAWDERDGVIGSVLKQYEGRSAMVCNHVFFQARMAIRETAKVYGLSERETSRIAKKLPWFMRSGGNILTAIKNLPQLRGVEFDEPWPEILTLAEKLIGAPRNLSVHPGGIVITPKALDSYVPIENAPKGVQIIQWEKDGAEEAGLVKIDLLGNRSLGVIRDAIESHRKNGGEFDDFNWEPEDDPATQKLVAKGDTMGCFYIESPATRQLQQKAAVGDFEHLVIHSSIIRPAANEYISEYVRRLHGGSWDPIHPLLENVLDETFGIMVYQEDVSKVAVSLAGFSHVEADLLRKIMSKKDKGTTLGNLKEKFADGARRKGVSAEKVEEVWRMILSFDGYSFCKPHSASYAKVSFQAAYLKRHYPAEFMAAVISNMGGFYSTFAYTSEAKRFGCEILPPDINRSEIRWKGRGRKMRTGFQSVKNLGSSAMERIVEEKSRREFESFVDFLERVKPSIDEARALVYCGAFEGVEGNKKQAPLLWQLACRQKTMVEDLSSAPRLLIGGNGGGIPESHRLPELPEESEIERLRRQYSVLGFLCDRHPIILYSGAVKKMRPVKAVDIRKHIGKRIRFAGWMITGKTVMTKHGEAMKFLTFEDETGIIETVFFPKAYERFCSILEYDKPYIIEGRVDRDDPGNTGGAITLCIESAKAL